MICLFAAALALGSGFSVCFSEVTLQEIRRILAAQEPDSKVSAFLRENAPARVPSAHELAQLARAHAPRRVLKELLQGMSQPATTDHPAEYVLEAPAYLPYYYEYYENYSPYIYAGPTFSFYFFNPSYYRQRFPELYRDHPYVVPSFPYFTHPLWKLHPSYPYHPFDAHGYHPWYDTMPPRKTISPRTAASENTAAHVD